MENKKKHILALYPNFNFNDLSDVELLKLKPENDLVKGFTSNRPKYFELKEIIQPWDETIFFDLCHLLGLFSKSGKEINLVIYAITYLYQNYSINTIIKFVANISDINYSPKLASMIISAIINNELMNNPEYYAYCCSNFKVFTKDVEKINKNRIRMIKNRGSSKPNDQIKLKQLRETGKTLTLEDTKDYIEKLVILHNCPQLENVANILLLETYDAEELKEIIKFYNYACHNTNEDEHYFENISLTVSTGNIIQWLPSLEPINLVLGYLLKVCSTFSGTGSKIMIDGILDPKNKHIILTDQNGCLIGKATCVYHDSYLFCGDLNFMPDILDNMSTSDEREYYYTYMLALNAQFLSLKRRGYNFNEIKMAMPEYMVTQSIKGREDINDFKELLSIATYFWEEMDEKLFDHHEPEYKTKSIN